MVRISNKPTFIWGQHPPAPTALHCAQRYTAPSATLRPVLHSAQRYTAPGVAQRATLHSALRYTAPSAAQRATLHSALRNAVSGAAQSAALHSAQRYTGPHAVSSAEWGSGLAPNCRVRTLTLHFFSHCELHSEVFWKVLAHCDSTLTFANSKVERFSLFVGDQAPRSSEQDESLQSRPSTAGQTRPTAASEPSRLRKGGLLRFLSSISACEKN